MRVWQKLTFGVMISCVFIVAMGAGMPLPAIAATITFSGTVSYQGTYSGDSLFVAVLDTTGVEDADLLVLQAFPVSAPPFSQGFSLDFDNTGVGSMLLIASFLDVDGGGVDSVSGSDVLGWYSGGSSPTGVSSAASQAGLDFDLPLAEIHGTVTFAPGQTDAYVWASDDISCATEGFRPQVEMNSEGAYSIIGIYPGSYCVGAEEYSTGQNLEVCFGGCAIPTVVTLTQTEVRNGIDLDFNDVVPIETMTWGQIKTKYP